MVAADADHLAQVLLAMLLKRLEISGIHRIRAGIPISFRPKAAFAPEAVLGHEQQSEFVTRIGEHRMMRIMRAAHEVEARVLDQLHIALAGSASDSDAPA